MCRMDCNRLSPRLKSFSYNSWIGKSWDSAYSIHQNVKGLTSRNENRIVHSVKGSNDRYVLMQKRGTERKENARIQQKELQEKEEKLLRLYEEQQKRALKSVGNYNGGGSSVGVGKVRSMFQSRRKAIEGKTGTSVVITGRDKSYPLEPLAKYPSARNLDRGEPEWKDRQFPGSIHQRSISLDRNKGDKVFRRNGYSFALDSRDQQGKSNLSFFGGVSADLQNGLEFGKNFQLVENNTEKLSYFPRARNVGYNRESEDYYLSSVDSKRQFNENQLRGEHENGFSKFGTSSIENKMEGRFKNFVSQNTLAKKTSVGSRMVNENSGLSSKQGAKEIGSTGYSGTCANSPVRKIRKPTPVPLSLAQTQLLQKEIKKRVKTETLTKISTPESTKKTSTSRISPSIKSSTPKSFSNSTTLSHPNTLPTKTATLTKSTLLHDLVNCKFCGRHFNADRVSKHEEVCQKSIKSKRKPFDALQQRVKGTEVEKYVKRAAKTMKNQTDKPEIPQTNWRKKHEEFIKNIRAAKEVSAHLKKGGKLSDLPPPPPSDYSDYIQCPHCSRKFNSTAAERHIPKCATMLHNKPKLQKSSDLKRANLLKASPAVRGRK